MVPLFTRIALALLLLPVVDADGGVSAERGPLGVVEDLVGREAGEARQSPPRLERQLVRRREGVADPWKRSPDLE